MAAPKGNRYWEMRKNHGCKPLFASRDALWKACCEYFDWVEDNPLLEAKAFSYQGETKITPIPKMRVMTIGGLGLFLGISEDTWANYRLKEDFIGIVTRAERIVREQKFTGAG